MYNLQEDTDTSKKKKQTRDSGEHLKRRFGPKKDIQL